MAASRVLLLCLPVLAGALSSLHAGASARRQESSMRAAVRGSLEAKVRDRFGRVDADDDGEVTLQELRAGFHDGSHLHADAVLLSMLRDCDIDASGACSRKELGILLKRSGSQLFDMSGLHAAFREKAEDRFVQVANSSLEKCGPSHLACTRAPSKCWGGNSANAWLLQQVCAKSPCLCEATAETRHFAKLGMSATMAISSVSGDGLLKSGDMPQCGTGWSGTDVSVTFDVVNEDTPKASLLAYGLSSLWKRPDTSEWVRKVVTAPSATLRAAIYKTRTHSLGPGRPSDSNVCVIAHPGTDSFGMWKINLLGNSEQHVKNYKRISEKLRKAVEKQCCSHNFTASKFVVTGHSFGGGMAVNNAMDMVQNWQCRGRDITASDIALVTIAHGPILTNALVDSAISCTDPSRCLAGSVVTIGAENDWVYNMPDLVHPSPSKKLSCPGPHPHPGGYRGFVAVPSDWTFASDGPWWWCHGIYNYAAMVEEELVGKGWGSSCDGHCGDPNTQLVHQQQKLIGDFSQVDAPESCDGGWQAETGKCSCKWMPCQNMTGVGRRLGICVP